MVSFASYWFQSILSSYVIAIRTDPDQKHSIEKQNHGVADVRIFVDGWLCQ